ncbi:MAG: winged helix-turn-helix domain-containing protein [Ghiorsea sp.]
MAAPSKHILIVEDDASIARLIEIHLQRAEYETTICDNGLDAQQLLEDNTYSALILDRMIPGKRGLDVLRWLRGHERIGTLPVLMVTALTMTDEKVRGLNEGADDYLGKPFEPDELIARLAALLRRSQSDKTASFDAQPIQLDEESMEVKVEGKLMPLRPLEFKLLQVMMAKPGRVFSRDKLLDTVWGMDSFVEERTVDATVKRLRKELATCGFGDCVQTVRGMGYRYQEKG